jgi:polyhydroxyalkanoate synthesis regulator protein
MPGFDAMQAQQEAFLKAMTGGWKGGVAPQPDKKQSGSGEDLAAIKRQLAELQEKLSKLK